MFRPAEDLYVKLRWTLFFVYVHVILFLHVYVTAFMDLSRGCMLNSQKASHLGTVEHAHTMNTGRGLQSLVTHHIFGAIVEINKSVCLFCGFATPSLKAVK